jgi:5-methylcytosine-specific restriction enzyme A
MSMYRHEFSKQVKLAAWQRCGGYCESCTAKLFVGKFQYDHRSPAAISSDRSLFNCQVLCTNCHDKKTREIDVPAIAKSNRIRARHLALGKAKGRPLPGTKASGWKHKMDGTWERRQQSERN